jgi:O-antigen/teichoic acid export membrane protein
VNLLSKVRLVFSNKVMLYLFTRYFTYFIQFVTSILIAVKLGPYYFGIWGFILLLINYFQITNFGISNSINILMVQHRSDENHVKNFVVTSVALVGILAIVIGMFAGYYFFFGISLLYKYNIGMLLFLICIIAICIHYNNLFQIIYRVKNRLFEVAFYQSVVPLLIFIALFLSRDRMLLIVLLIAYLLGNGLSILIFIKGKQIPWGGKSNLSDAGIILKKGFYLFIYNICFYLIIVSTRTVVSVFYTVEDFGYFTFSFTLAHAVLLFLDALTFIIFPKIIDKLNSQDKQSINDTLKMLRINYVSISHGLVYVAIVLFPVFVYFLPKYQSTVLAFNLIALTVALNTNFFGYTSFLMAQNQEKTIAKVSVIGLILNITIALCLVYLFHVKYMYVVLATLISYWIYSYICVFYANRILEQKTTFLKVMKEGFPLHLMIPYIIALIFVIANINLLLFIPLVFYLIFNLRYLMEIKETIKKVILKPDVINIA